jgi:hypothetical protein
VSPNRPRSTEFPASVTENVASGSQGCFSGMMQGSVITSFDISIRCRIKDKHLLFLGNCCGFCCRFMLVRTDYKVIQFTYTDFARGGGHRMLICRRH